MKPIKFRAWEERSKTMFNVFDMRWRTSGEFLGGGDTWFGEDCLAPAEKWSLKIMQFTGLLDKNGKEIYEGDIVEVHFSNTTPSPTVMKLPVFFDQGSFNVLNLNGEPMTLREALIEGNKKSAGYFGVEVIGNIYENPDLINSL